VRYSGVGGSATYFKVPVWYAFRHEDGRVQHITGTINLAPWEPNRVQFPSLLGWDVLAQFRLTMDWAQRSVELHEATV